MAWFIPANGEKNGLIGLDSEAELVINEAVAVDGDENQFYLVVSVEKARTKIEGIGDAKDKPFEPGVYTIISPKKEFTNQKGKKQAPTSFQRAIFALLSKGELEWGKPFKCIIQPVSSSLIEMAMEEGGEYLKKLKMVTDFEALESITLLEGKTNVGGKGGGGRQYKSFTETMTEKLGFIGAMAKEGSPLEVICETLYDTVVADNGDVQFVPISKNDVLKAWLMGLLK